MLVACFPIVVGFLFTLASVYGIKTNLPTNLNIIEAMDIPCISNLTILFLLGLFLILIGIALLLKHYNIKI